MAANLKQIGGEHYKGGIEVWDFIVANKIPYLEGNAIKYIVRHKKKGGKADIKKAIHYLEKLLEVETPDTPLSNDQLSGTVGDIPVFPVSRIQSVFTPLEANNAKQTKSEDDECCGKEGGDSTRRR